MKSGKFIWFTAVAIPVVLFLLAPYWGAVFTEKKKSLSYQVLSKQQLTDLDLESALGSQLSFSFNGKDIKKGTFVTVAIENKGDVPIQEEDFSTSIRIETKGGEVLSYQLVSSHPENLSPALSQQGNDLYVRKLLLNPGDSFSVRLFSGSDIDVVDVTSRVSGISQVEKEVVDQGAGVYITDISAADGRKAEGNRLVELPVYLVIPVMFILMLAMMFNMFRTMEDSSVTVIVIRWLFAIFLYGVSLVLYMVVIASLSSHYAFSMLGTLVVGLSVLALACCGGYFTSAYFTKLSLAHEE